MVLADVRETSRTLEAWLVWHQDDRFILGHPSDHVSGMPLVKGLLDAHLRLMGKPAVPFNLRCVGFAEHHAPIHALAHLAGPDSVRIAIV